MLLPLRGCSARDVTLGDKDMLGRLILARCFLLQIFLLVCFQLSDVPANAADLNLTKDEAEVVQSIVDRDQLLKQMFATQMGLEALNGLAGRVITGPVELVVQWNQANLKLWS